MTKEKANALTLCNKAGWKRKSITRWTCVPPLKGRKGQGKGRVSSTRGLNCKYGVRATGFCRTKQRFMQNKRAGAAKRLAAKYPRAYLNPTPGLPAAVVAKKVGVRPKSMRKSLKK